jgi:hypothetical protein
MDEKVELPDMRVHSFDSQEWWKGNRRNFSVDLSFKAKTYRKNIHSGLIIHFLCTRDEERFTPTIISCSYVYLLPIISRYIM